MIHEMHLYIIIQHQMHELQCLTRIMIIRQARIIKPICMHIDMKCRILIATVYRSLTAIPCWIDIAIPWWVHTCRAPCSAGYERQDKAGCILILKDVVYFLATPDFAAYCRILPDSAVYCRILPDIALTCH